MKASFSDDRSGYSVIATEADIEAFALFWPCSGLLDEDGYGYTIVFYFDKNGDLFDILGEPPDAAGAAMVALSQDARKYAQKHRNFQGLHELR